MSKTKIFKTGLFLILCISFFMIFSKSNKINAASNQDAYDYTFVSSKGIDQGTTFTYRGPYTDFSSIVGSNSKISIKDRNTLNCVVYEKLLKDDSFTNGGYYYTQRTDSVVPLHGSESNVDEPYYSETHYNNTGMTTSPNWRYAVESNGEIQYATEANSTLLFTKPLKEICYLYIIIQETYGISYVGDENNYYYGYIKYSFKLNVENNQNAYDYTFANSKGIDQGTTFTYRGPYTDFSSIVGSNSKITIKDSFTLNCVVYEKLLKDDSFTNGGDYYTQRTDSVVPLHGSESNVNGPFNSETYHNNTGMTTSPHWIYAVESNGEIQYATEASSTLQFTKPLKETCYLYIIIRETYGYSYSGDENTYHYGYIKYSFKLNVDLD